MCDFVRQKRNNDGLRSLLPRQGFGPVAKTREGIIVSPAYTYKGAIAEYPAQIVVLDSNATVVPQWNGTLSK